MSYIGNAKTPLLLASNVRDDLVPDGAKKIFDLSQEVPGGEGINVCVVRRRYLTDVLVENTNAVEFSQVEPAPGEDATQSKITITDNHLAAALALVLPRSATTATDGDSIKITLSSTTVGPFPVVSVSYDRDSLTIILEGVTNVANYVTVGTNITKLERFHYGSWEILDPETQYEIVSATGFTNRQIEIKDLVPNINDLLYVLHRGQATYNFVPSPSSVGPDQLAPNLRNFAVDSVTFDAPGEKVLQLSQLAPAANTILVTANGVVQISTNEIKEKDSSISDEDNTGTWTLENAVGTTQYITLKESLFVDAVANPVSIRVLHLSFSTISRRAAFSPGQDPKFLETGSVTTNILATNSVSTTKIQDNAVTGAKIRLSKNEALRFQTQASPNTEVQVLALDQTTNDTQIISSTSVQIKPGNATYTFTESAVVPSSNLSLGSSDNKFKDIHISGTANLENVQSKGIDVDGDITVTGKIDNIDISDLKDQVTNLSTTVDDLIKFLVPVGIIVPSATPSSIVTQFGEWVLCDGRRLSRTNYGTLFNALSQNGIFGPNNWPWGFCDSNEFAIPDLRRRLVLGKTDTDNLGANDGITTATQRSLSHSHTGAAHTHTIAHTHTVPGHKHTVNSSATGSINISTSSGSHDTNLEHSHSGNTGSTSLRHTHNLTHGHSGKTDNNDSGGSHYHGGSTSSTGQHRHTIEYTEHNNIRRDGTTTIRSLGGSSTTAEWLSMESSHGHNISTGAAVNFDHKHPFTIASQTNESGDAIAATGTGATNNLTGNTTSDLGHTHTISLTTISTANTTDSKLSTSTGVHTHAGSSFSGFIGNASSDPEGNSALTTNTQSTNISGDADYGTNRTGAETLPYVIINYLIKAK